MLLQDFNGLVVPSSQVKLLEDSDAALLVEKQCNCYLNILTAQSCAVCMYVCMVITYSRVWINRVRLPILAVSSRVSLLISTQDESGAYLRDSFRVPRRRPFMKPPYAIGSVPSLSGHANAYRWRSLPRIRRHRASKPQGSSKRVLPWQITMDQLIFASLSHTHYWYEADMLKIPAGALFVNKSNITINTSSFKW